MSDFLFFDPQPEDVKRRGPNCDGRHVRNLGYADSGDEFEVLNEALAAHNEVLPTHPEILELIESLLESDPSMKPARELPTCRREHAVFIPEHYEPGYAYPLIVWFHGEGASEADLAEVMPMISDRNYIGVAIRGDVKSGNGYGWSMSDPASSGMLDDVRLIVSSLRREYHIHSERIYLAGFGSGATVAMQLMLAKPEWFGAAAGFGGTVPGPKEEATEASDLTDKRILLGAMLGSKAIRVSDVVGEGWKLYLKGMKVGTRIYQHAVSEPTEKMLRDLNAWLMDDICSGVRV